MKTLYLLTLTLLLSACNGSGGGSSSNTNPSNPDDGGTPCTDCNGDTPPGVKIEYSNASTNDVFLYSDNWEAEYGLSDHNSSADHFVALPDPDGGNYLELTNRVSDTTYGISTAIKKPFCNTYDKYAFFAWSDEATTIAKGVRLIEVQNNVVSLYDITFTVSSGPITGTIDYTLVSQETYNCENGILQHPVDTDSKIAVSKDGMAIAGRTSDADGAWTIIGFNSSLVSNDINDTETGSTAGEMHYTYLLYSNQFVNLADGDTVFTNQATSTLYDVDGGSDYDATHSFSRVFPGTSANLWGFSEGIYKKSLMFFLKPNTLKDKDGTDIKKFFMGVYSSNLDSSYIIPYWAAR